jgi:hypothetical protein
MYICIYICTYTHITHTNTHTHTQARQHKLQQLWHVESHPKVLTLAQVRVANVLLMCCQCVDKAFLGADVLTLAQDRNVAKFLSQGINKVFLKSPHIAGLFCPCSRPLLTLVWYDQQGVSEAGASSGAPVPVQGGRPAAGQCR